MHILERFANPVHQGTLNRPSMMEFAIPTSVTPTPLSPYWYGRTLSSIILGGIFHLSHTNVTVQLNLPQKLLFWKPLPLCRCPLLGLQPFWDGLPLVATSCAWVVASWMRGGLICFPASLLLHVPQFFMRFSAQDLLAFCTCSGVLTSMFMKCGILGSEVAASFLAATCSLSLFFAFSLFVFSPCFFTFSCRASSSFFKSLPLLVGGCVISGNSISWPSACNSIKSLSYSWTSCCCIGNLVSIGLPPLKGLLGVGGGPSWVGDGFAGLYGWDSQRSLTLSGIVPCLTEALGVGGRFISVLELVGGLATSKSRTLLPFALLGSSGPVEAFLFCGCLDTCSDWLTSSILGYVGTSCIC